MKHLIVSVVLGSLILASSVRAEDQEKAERHARREAKAAAAAESSQRSSGERAYHQPRQNVQQTFANRGGYQPVQRTPQRQQYTAPQQLERNRVLRSDANARIQARELYRQNLRSPQSPSANVPSQIHDSNLNGRTATFTPEERAARRAARQQNQQLVNRTSFVEAAARHGHDHHDRNWWRNHCTRFVLIGGGYYAWDAGYWYPAWGYDNSYSYYAYEGPIYAYDDLPPDQVVANVQAALQQDGYYDGDVDGDLGPLTRVALGRYQRDHGLLITSAVDEPTMASLGLL